MKLRLLPHPLLTPALTVIWLLLVNSLSFGHVLLGLLLGWLIPIFTLRFWPDRVRVHKPLTLLRFVLVLLYDILVANLGVAWLIVRGPRRVKPGFVEVPLALRSELGISLLANTISLTPGTVSAWLSPDRATLVVHALDVDDPEALVATIKHRYETPLQEVFEPC
ncbi:Na+/H+ antiporter subunit E [Marichromatium gracile]|uniref:Multisubunit potassium/proton antiporter PhaE subunit n=1 Tax=Marichromatium gracile TaxID=1048 RepID=A0A4R4ALV7_MARGR|nr:MULTISPECIES: Na+/H+ antiporter subunit E [Marichromatium]MBO8086028.1 Na+/H+ antiporter subunit E [Marichromatium sp.]MBK1707473.1 Na+/H+ antiporter subunit E [Marichromatium gracile]MCF1184282.1 Na+/H+ antiporter subunit E [Marichromatium gracile]RNE92050.1 Na+/H+ antiporter subunit E [Marichromatium sp. AB31]RNE94084.1 Na+/H+ antiporter subunit E [Marichromatium sp. AB32]